MDIEDSTTELSDWSEGTHQDASLIESPLRATFGSPDHPVDIGGLQLQCYVLETGQRVLVQNTMISALGMKQGGNPKGRSTGRDRLARFAAGQALEPYIDDELLSKLNDPIRFRTPRGGTVAYGYEATVLVDICEAVLKARDDKKLQTQQEHIARQCEVLVRGFARVGIIALVDEATGYQEVRDRNALHKILEAYISKELLPWTKRFPDEFYKELFRLRGWTYSPLAVGPQGPRYVGKLTNEIVYDRLPPGVLEALRANNPIVKDGRRKYRHHQFLTPEIGNPHLEKHLAIVTALMRASPNWDKFKRLLARALPRSTGQQELPLEYEDDFELGESPEE